MEHLIQMTRKHGTIYQRVQCRAIVPCFNHVSSTIASHELSLRAVEASTSDAGSKSAGLPLGSIAPSRLAQTPRLRQEQGVSLVEFALILPLFLLLLLGMVDLGQGFNRYLVMLNATREGAMWLGRHPTDIPGMEARIAGELQQSGLLLENIVVTRTPQKGAYASGDLVKVTLEYQYTLLFGSITRIPSLTLQTAHTIRVQ